MAWLKLSGPGRKISNFNMKRSRKGLLLLAASLLLSLGNGCAAYNGLIGHPLSVLREQHEANEQQEQARGLGQKMFEDTHP